MNRRDQKYKIVVMDPDGKKLTYHTVSSYNLLPLIEVLLANETSTVLVALDKKENEGNASK